MKTVGTRLHIKATEERKLYQNEYITDENQLMTKTKNVGVESNDSNKLDLLNDDEEISEAEIEAKT